MDQRATLQNGKGHADFMRLVVEVHFLERCLALRSAHTQSLVPRSICTKPWTLWLRVRVKTDWGFRRLQTQPLATSRLRTLAECEALYESARRSRSAYMYLMNHHNQADPPSPTATKATPSTPGLTSQAPNTTAKPVFYLHPVTPRLYSKPSIEKRRLHAERPVHTRPEETHGSPKEC